MRKNIALFAIIIIAALLEQSRLAVVSHVNPNLVLSSLTAFAFIVPDFLIYILLAAIGSALLRTLPTFEFSTIALMLCALAFYGFKKISPWRPLVSVIALSFSGTLLFYTITDYHFITWNFLILKELVYNVIVSVALHITLTFVYEKV